MGPLPDRRRVMSDYAPLRHGQHWVRYPGARYVPGAYVIAGLGAHGLTTAGLCRPSSLACHVTGEPSPVEADLVAALHPGRFIIRSAQAPRQIEVARAPITGDGIELIDIRFHILKMYRVHFIIEKLGSEPNFGVHLR